MSQPVPSQHHSKNGEEEHKSSLHDVFVHHHGPTPQQEAVSRRVKQSRPSTSSTSSLPRFRQSESTRTPQSDSGSRSSQTNEKKKRHHVPMASLPIYEEMMRDAGSIRKAAELKAKAKGSPRPIRSSPAPQTKQPGSSPHVNMNQKGEETPSRHGPTPKANPSQQEGKKPERHAPISLPIYEQMMRKAEAARKAADMRARGSHRPVPSPLPTKVKLPEYTPKPTTHQENLVTYIKGWANLQRHEAEVPCPNPHLNKEGQSNSYFIRTVIDLDVSREAELSRDTIMSLNTQIFFLKGNDLLFTFLLVDGVSKFVISIRNNMEKVKALRSYLKKKELARWHPDRMNLRTGIDGGVPDERLGTSVVVTAIRTGVDQLIERCEEAVTASEEGGRGR